MATITPVSSRPAPEVVIFTWETLTEADTAASIVPNGTTTLAGTLQVFGTFGGATLVLQGSNDNSNWVTLRDTDGSNISFTTAGYAEFSTGMAYLRVSASGGSSQDLDCIMSLRG